MLSQLLAHNDCTAETIPAFLEAYERVRRPRASMQQTHARESGEVGPSSCFHAVRTDSYG